jgi:hypothetical protein
MILHRFRLLWFFAPMLFLSCAHQRAGGLIDPMSGVEYSRFVCIASIKGDPELSSRLSAMFRKAGIIAVIEGSVAYGVSVAPANKASALELLRADTRAHDYPIQFYGD